MAGDEVLIALIDKLGFNLIAFFHTIAAPGVKAASGGRIQGTRYFAFKAHIFDIVRIGDRNRIQ